MTFEWPLGARLHPDTNADPHVAGESRRHRLRGHVRKCTFEAVVIKCRNRKVPSTRGELVHDVGRDTRVTEGRSVRQIIRRSSPVDDEPRQIGQPGPVGTHGRWQPVERRGASSCCHDRYAEWSERVRSFTIADRYRDIAVGSDIAGPRCAAQFASAVVEVRLWRGAVDDKAQVVAIVVGCQRCEGVGLLLHDLGRRRARDRRW
jgi:hypothetical protein